MLVIKRDTVAYTKDEANIKAYHL